jgi:hypothetical protein
MLSPKMKNPHFDKKICFVVDSYPSNEEHKGELLGTLKKFREEGIDVLLTSHHPCTPEIIEQSTYFIFEKENTCHFLESEIINNKDFFATELSSTLFHFSIPGRRYYNGIISTGYTKSIVSNFFNSIRVLRGKGYDLVFWLVDDFKYPESGFNMIVDSIMCEMRESGSKNYFFENLPSHLGWYNPSFFVFSLDDKLISDIPNQNFSDFEMYNKNFMGRVFESFLFNLFRGNPNLVKPCWELDVIFSPDGWNTRKSRVDQSDPSFFHSVHIGPNSKASFFLAVPLNYQSKKIEASLNVYSEITGESIFRCVKGVERGGWSLIDFDLEVNEKKSIVMEKEIKDLDNPSLSFRDIIILNSCNIRAYSKLKYFEYL